MRGQWAALLLLFTAINAKITCPNEAGTFASTSVTTKNRCDVGSSSIEAPQAWESGGYSFAVIFFGDSEWDTCIGQAKGLATTYASLTPAERSRVLFIAVGRDTPSPAVYSGLCTKGAYPVVHSNKWWKQWSARQYETVTLVKASCGEWQVYCRYSLLDKAEEKAFPATLKDIMKTDTSSFPCIKETLKQRTPDTSDDALWCPGADMPNEIRAIVLATACFVTAVLICVALSVLRPSANHTQPMWSPAPAAVVHVLPLTVVGAAETVPEKDESIDKVATDGDENSTAQASGVCQSCFSTLAALPGSIGLWCWPVLLSLAFGAGGIFGSVFAKYWFSLAITGSLGGFAIGMLAYNAENRRGYRPFRLGSAALPCMMLQPLLLAINSRLEDYTLMNDEAVNVMLSITTWFGMTGMIVATCWNGSLDHKLRACCARCHGSPEQDQPSAVDGSQ